jgi:FAD/FMN-containing dehydrogenase
VSALAQSRASRRGLLAGAAALGLTGSVAGCGSSRSTSPTGATEPSTPPQTTTRPTTTVPTTTAGPPDWAALGRELDGALLRPGDASFAGTARLYDPRFDRRRPDAVVEASGTADITAALAFARRYGLTVSPRAGGHSYVGASAGRGGIQIDTRRLDAVHYDAASQTVTAGAGAALLAVHTALEPVGRTVPTGTCASVGVAGLTLGGGLGVEDRTYGLTCDAAESFRLVTAAGDVLVASATQHADLFWACRGGGGGNLGVLIEVRYRTFPAHPMSFFSLRWSDQQAEAVIRGWQTRVPAMPRSSWANLHLDAATGTGLTPSIFGVSLDGAAESEADALVAAVGAAPVGRSTYTRSHHDGVLLLAGCAGEAAAHCRLPPHGTLAREISVAGSDVIGRPLNASQRSAVAHLLRGRASKGQSASAIVDPLGGAASAPGPTATAFAWRRALATIQWYVGLSAVPSGSTTRATYDWIDEGHRTVAGASVGGYVNYLEPGRPLADYYGPNFDRLRAARRRYDPDQLFHGAFVIPH